MSEKTFVETDPEGELCFYSEGTTEAEAIEMFKRDCVGEGTYRLLELTVASPVWEKRQVAWMVDGEFGLKRD